jgi:hypothetical protein
LGYPEGIKDFDFENDLEVVLNCGVFDIEKGTVLKLVEGRQITHALHGFESLTMDKIKEMYGDPPIFKNLKWPDTNQCFTETNGPHETFMGI